MNPVLYESDWESEEELDLEECEISNEVSDKYELFSKIILIESDKITDIKHQINKSKKT
jgi:hypothetical protein